jgi:hypothetical protein
MKRNILRTVTVVMAVLLLHIAATPPALLAQAGFEVYRPRRPSPNLPAPAPTAPPGPP